MRRRFTRDDVEAVAALARLELTEPEIELFARQLGEVLEYAAYVQRIDTTDVPPTSSVLAVEPGTDRPDEVLPSLDRRAALANAPEAAAAAGLFKVPRVIE